MTLLLATLGWYVAAVATARYYALSRVAFGQRVDGENVRKVMYKSVFLWPCVLASVWIQVQALRAAERRRIAAEEEREVERLLRENP